jgi:hypothetical protein
MKTLSILVVSFAILTGCSSSATHPASSPMDASWTPSESVDVAIKDGTQPLHKSSVEANGQGRLRPNAASIPQRGAVHAAVY